MITYYGSYPQSGVAGTVGTTLAIILPLAQTSGQLTIEDNFGVWDLEIINSGVRDVAEIQFRHSMDFITYSAYPDISDAMAAALVPLLKAGMTLKLRLYIPIGHMRIYAKTVAADGEILVKYERVEISYTEPVANGTKLSTLIASSSSGGGAALGKAIMPFKELYSTTHEKGLEPIDFYTNVVGTGTVTHEDDISAADLAVAVAIDDVAHMQSKEHFKFQLGSEMVFKFEFLMGAGQKDVMKKVGVFNALDGFYLLQNDDAASTLQFVMRTSTGGAGAVNTAIDQDDWNVDILDGTGQSGETLDIEAVQQMFIRFGGQAGYVEFGFFIDGDMCIAHRLYIGNNQALPLASWLTLPLAALIIATDVPAGVDHLFMFSWFAGGYGDVKRKGCRVAATTGVVPKELGIAGIAVLAVRGKNGSNYELGSVAPKGGCIMAEAEGMYYWRIVVGGAINAGWAAAADLSSGRSESVEDNVAVGNGIEIANGVGAGVTILPEFNMAEVLAAHPAFLVGEDPGCVALEVTAINQLNAYLCFDVLELM